MRYLFLHPNFPGQFVRPAALAAGNGHEVKFLCHTHYGRNLPGVQRITLKGDLGESALAKRKLSGLSHAQALAEQYYKAMQQLSLEGWHPDTVVSHSGWGCGLHSALVWPSARRIAYVEWWFAVSTPLYNFDAKNKWWPGPGDGRSLRERNLPLALELSEADQLIAPTKWQRQQLPSPLQQRCQVIPDGVDLKRFKPDPLMKAKRPLLTYGTRGMEPMRCFPEFIEALPQALRNNPELEVEIAGDDRICYGGAPPAEGSYGKWAKIHLKPWIESNRVRFIGRVAPTEYPGWLRRSWLHLHLTRPYVASWSLLEAMASGCCLIASNTEPVREFVGPKSAALVDCRTKNWLGPVVEALLSDQRLRNKIGNRARETAEGFDERFSAEAWKNLLCARTQT